MPEDLPPELTESAHITAAVGIFVTKVVAAMAKLGAVDAAALVEAVRAMSLSPDTDVAGQAAFESLKANLIRHLEALYR